MSMPDVCPHCGRHLDEQAAGVIERATALLESGMTGVAVAHHLGLRPERLSYLMAKTGTPVKSFKQPAPGAGPGSSNPQRTKKMLELHRSGSTYRVIAERFDLSPHRVHQIIRAHRT